MNNASMHLSVAHCTELGDRPTNQDFIGFCANEQLGCFALADGAGGHEGGAQASRAVVNEVLRTFQAAPVARCTDAAWPIAVARAALATARQRHPDCAEMNTTVAVLLLNTETGRATWCQLGDSRVYLFRHGRAHQLSHDHSVMQAMLDAGFMQADLAEPPTRNTLYAAVGSSETPPTAVCDAPLTVSQGDVFLLCSDGFWELVPEAVMEETLRDASTPEVWIAHMLASIPQPAHPSDTDKAMDNFSALTVWAGQRIEATRILDWGAQHAGRVVWRG